MKALLICTSVLGFLAGPALAEEVIIHHDAPDAVEVHRSIGADVESKTVIDHDGHGCDSKTVTKTNEMGDTHSKTVTNC